MKPGKYEMKKLSFMFVAIAVLAMGCTPRQGKAGEGGGQADSSPGVPSAALQEQIDDPDVKIDAPADDLDVRIDALADDMDLKIDALADDLTGVIVMWSGSIGSIPSGWALCDGTNGTPDLGARFVLGTRTGTDPGQTGGSAAHSHGIAGHTHKVSPEGLHVHETNRQTRAVTAGSGTLALIAVTVRSGSGRHSHDTSSEAVSTGAEDHSPPYYRLAFIMRL